eukprot:gnl/Ergobibamus_cyprinoides/5451.p2 GENE.gnl/Ergobibamus_cyprinoides/5451~~gnl/Ergobibamus_cyprinoides/5451.p2  ORF type:complete len:126 (-),score=11.08 gnl/Ergobibamus_cyprinoides/5451:83-460(-)
MYSFGCVLAELYTGHPLFPGRDEADQLARQMQVMGLPPQDLIQAAPRRKVFFTERPQSRPRFAPNPVKDSRGRVRRPSSRTLAAAVHRPADDDFVSFLQGCLEWSPSARFTPDEALAPPLDPARH